MIRAVDPSLKENNLLHHFVIPVSLNEIVSHI